MSERRPPETHHRKNQGDGYLPKVTIGVTTYRRHRMLTACLESILDQTFDDYEVLVSNDCVEDPICLEDLGLCDARLKIVNQRENLGEARNLNWLLETAGSDYFTWLADDDMYASTYLANMTEVLEENADLQVVFCGFHQGETFPQRKMALEGESGSMSGTEFLDTYLSQRIRTLGVYGLYRRNYLRRRGGIQVLGTGFSPYSDNLLVLESGTLSEVAFNSAPLVFFRTHPDSISFTSESLEAYVTAQTDLADRCDRIFDIACSGDKRAGTYVLLLLRWFVRDFCGLIFRCKGVSFRDVAEFGTFLVRRSRWASLIPRTGLLLYLTARLLRPFIRLALGPRLLLLLKRARGLSAEAV